MTKLFLLIVLMHVNPQDLTTLNRMQQQPVTIQTACNTAKVVLEKSKIPNFTQWKIENTALSPVVKSGRVYIDLSTLTRANKALWLFNNNAAIIFDESAAAITCIHAIPNIGLFGLGTVKTTKTLGEIRVKLADAGAQLVDSSRKYVELSFDTNDIFAAKPYSTYDSAKYYYSTGFFIALGRQHQGDATKLTFYKATYQFAPVIVIEVMGSTSTYYDFSQFPIQP